MSFYGKSEVRSAPLAALRTLGIGSVITGQRVWDETSKSYAVCDHVGVGYSTWRHHDVAAEKGIAVMTHWTEAQPLAARGGWLNLAVAGGSCVTTDDEGQDADHPGSVTLAIDAGTADSRAGVRTDVCLEIAADIVFRFGALIRVSDLATASTDDWRIQLGLKDGTILGETADGVYFYYDSASTAIRCKTAASSVRTNTSSAVDLVADTWVKVDFELYNGTARYWVNDALVATISANITTSTDLCWFLATHRITSSAGVAKKFIADYTFFEHVNVG